MPVEIRVQHLPEIDILRLAQTGMILRAELETETDGVPAFITRIGWNELLAHHLLQEHLSQKENSPNSAQNSLEFQQKLLKILSRITAKLMQEAARYYQEHPNNSPHNFTIETDLFPSSKEASLIFIRAKDTNIACALLGTDEHLRHILSHSSDS